MDEIFINQDYIEWSTSFTGIKGTNLAHQGLSFEYMGNCHWRVLGSDEEILKITREITFSNDKYRVTMKGALIQPAVTNPNGNHECNGIANSTEITFPVRGRSKDTAMLIINIDEWFKEVNLTWKKVTTYESWDQMKDTLSGVKLLPCIEVSMPGADMEVFFFSRTNSLFILSHKYESVDAFSENAKILKYSLSYLSGYQLDGDCTEIHIQKEKGEGTAMIYSGRERQDRLCNYPPILCHKNLKLGNKIVVLDGDVVEKFATRLKANKDLVSAMELMSMYQDASIGVRGVLASVALESVANQIIKKYEDDDICSIRPIKDKDVYIEIKMKIDGIIRGYQFSQEELRLIDIRIQGLRNPTNKDSLSKPFGWLGYELTTKEEEMIGRRNSYLHGRLYETSNDKEITQQPGQDYKDEMVTMTLVNKLILGFLGYQGQAIDWGKKDPDSNESYPVFNVPTKTT